jgi:hypothetical protein
MARYWNDYGFFPPSRPRQAKGGIRAQSKRGAFGESWWARRWVSVLEAFDLGARLGRGRSYARRGRVLDVSIESGLVEARVQGSRPAPYKVTIKVKAPSPREVRAGDRHRGGRGGVILADAAPDGPGRDSPEARPRGSGGWRPSAGTPR